MEPETEPEVDLQIAEVDPTNVRYSQISISSAYTWHPLIYSPILVVRYDDGRFTSFDNRRLYSAQGYRARHASFTLVVDLHHTSESLARHEKFRCVLTWKDSATQTGVYQFVVYPQVYGAAIALRCARQQRDFPLEGQAESPIIDPAPNTSHRADVQIKGKSTRGPNEMVRLTVEQAVQKLEEVCANTSEADLYCGLTQGPGQLFAHSMLKEYLSGRVEQLLDVEEGSFYPTWWLRATADFDIVKQDLIDGDEAATIDAEVEMEREQLWLADMDEAWQLARR